MCNFVIKYNQEIKKPGTVYLTSKTQAAFGNAKGVQKTCTEGEC